MQPTEEQLKAQQELIKQEEQRFTTQVAEAHTKLKGTHERKEYTFSTIEKRRLAQLQLMTEFITQATDDIINMSVLPRLEIQPNPEVRVLYDITLGRFTVWLPKKIAEKDIKADQTPSPEI